MSQAVDGRNVADVMTRDVLCVDADLPLQVLPQVLVERGVSGTPVQEHGKVVGVVSMVDVLIALRDGPAATLQPTTVALTTFYLGPAPLSSLVEHGAGLGSPGTTAGWRVRDIMTTRLLTVAPSDPVATAARRMIEQRVHRLLVVEGSRLVGLVSALDLLAGLTDPTPAPPSGTTGTVG